ncbi:MAG: polyphosphate kinase 1 [Deltaproteobacteria bacterium]|nr:polyphosphate kinase 1 [Deltaproteobacteria bacterium]
MEETLREPVEAPEAADALDSPELFLNRELTWLAFNSRVLHEAERGDSPLLERVKFLAIVGSNLDEFIMKRIGGLKQQLGAGVRALTVDGRTPAQQIDESYEAIRAIEERQHAVHRELLAALETHGIRVVTYDELPSKQRLQVQSDYYENIFPLVTPQTSDPAHPFPFVSNLSLNLLVTYRGASNAELSRARIKVPVGAGIPRFLQVDGERTFVSLESVMMGNLDLLLPGALIESCALFRVTRNANTELSVESADDLLALIETGMRDRKFAPIVRLEVGSDIPAQQRGMLAAELGLDEHADVFEAEGLLAMRDLMELTQIADPDLQDPPFAPVDHPSFAREDQSSFHVIREAGALLVHHPYHSYATSVERFLRDASRDPKVRAIKMTLYRTDAGSKAIDYLIDAARNGKQVAAVVELQARFEEEANIRWANRLEEAGIHVTYGVLDLKTHCKVILVVRQDYSGLQRYAHIGTGNYNAETARLYTDVGLFTCDPSIGKDLTELFNYLSTGFKPRRNYSKILPAPKHCKQALLHKIEREIEHVREGRDGQIQIKTNAIEDVDIARALYRASRAGVLVDLIVRDTCRLRPGIPGLSENVRVVSVVGRFLEHSRIYHFRNGGDEEYYIGSADCMKRNLESRVEVLVPVEAEELRKELRHVMSALLRDTRGAWEMHGDGSYTRIEAAADEEAHSAQELLAERAVKQHKQATRLKRRGLRSTPRKRRR